MDNVISGRGPNFIYIYTSNRVLTGNTMFSQSIFAVFWQQFSLPIHEPVVV